MPRSSLLLQGIRESVEKSKRNSNEETHHDEIHPGIVYGIIFVKTHLNHYLSKLEPLPTKKGKFYLRIETNTRDCLKRAQNRSLPELPRKCLYTPSPAKPALPAGVGSLPPPLHMRPNGLHGGGTTLEIYERDESSITQRGPPRAAAGLQGGHPHARALYTSRAYNTKQTRENKCFYLLTSCKQWQIFKNFTNKAMKSKFRVMKF